MAIAFVPINGIGLGHVSRSFSLARALRELGEAPVIFSQGIYPEFMAAEIPGVTVGPLYKLPPEERGRLASEIAEFTRRTSPAVVIEDTHPASIRFDASICTVLIVRPTELQSMRDLRDRETGAYRCFAVADHPDSPTWPYDPAGTVELCSWADWKIMGPVFRSPTDAGRARIRGKYALRDGQAVYVFTMGGGGSQPGVHEAIPFLDRALEIVAQIERRAPGSRFLFIRGPLFPGDFKVPPEFETYSVENDMPSLLAEASGVIGRPSMNMLWESMGAGAPLLALPGKTYLEPIAERLSGMTKMGLLPVNFEQWMDASWRAEYRVKASEAAARWPLRGAAEILRSCFPKSASAADPAPPVHFVPRTPKNGSPALAIRIDDVAEPDERLMSLLAICAARGLAVSLEIVPYLSRMSAADIPAGVRYEVSQHGYAHLRHPNGVGAEAMRRGYRLLTEAFPAHFRGGFSPPFDDVPAHLSAAWLAAGGRYLTTIEAERDRSPIPTFRFTARAWDREIDPIVADIRRDLRRRGCAGLVLHSQRAGFARIEELLDRVLDLGCTSKLTSEIVLGREATSSR